MERKSASHLRRLGIGPWAMDVPADIYDLILYKYKTSVDSLL